MWSGLLDVRGGAQFSKAIEEALEAADVVVDPVVEQTQSSSRGVRDEASVGRRLSDAWSRLDLRYGNLAEAAGALKLMQSGKVSASRIGEAFVRARLDPTKANVDHAVELATVRGRMLTEWQNSSARLASSVERTSH